MGFDGLALWGALWENESRAVSVFREVKVRIAQAMAVQAAREAEAAEQED